MKEVSVKLIKLLILCLVLTLAVMVRAQSRNWQTGTLLETEQQKVLEGRPGTKPASGNGNNGNYWGINHHENG